MRKLSWIVAAVCVLAIPVCAQSRHRGYQAAGGWHRKISAPVPVAKREKKQNDKRTPAPPLPPAPAPPTR